MRLKQSLGWPGRPGGRTLASGRLRSVADQAEGMPRRVRIDTPAPPISAVIQHRRAADQHLLLRSIQVRNTEVQRELLGPGGIRPLRWPVIRCPLESEHKTGRRVQRRPVVVERPSLILLIDRPADQ
jgi:hypothetical protein